MQNEYCMYLRKSRADMEAEVRGEGETLKRHETILLELSRKLKTPITKIYKEIVSGETIAARPVMQQVLSEVEDGMWAGVFVVEVERLARGNTLDQGIVAQAFKFSNTKIITPVKTYDPNNEFDEEYFEFGLFMSRREYKTINRRLQQGRMTSVKEGKWVANIAPFGYKRVKLEHDKGFTLEIVPEQASIIKMIYELSLKNMGCSLIQKELNKLNIPAPIGEKWSSASIRDILRNPVYTGKIKWGCHANKKSIKNGQVVITRPRSKDYLTVPGLHKAIISDDAFNKVQDLRITRQCTSTPTDYTVVNPLAGLIVCGKCGARMSRAIHANSRDSLDCRRNYCNQKSAVLEIVEQRVLEGLYNLLQNYKVSLPKSEQSEPLIDMKEKNIENNNKEIKKLEMQNDNLHDLLEQGIYDTNTFLNRSKIIAEKTAKLTESNYVLSQELEKEKKLLKQKNTIIPSIENVLQTYHTLSTGKEKNILLKSVIEKIVYNRENSSKGKILDDFELTIYPKVRI